MTMEPFRRKLIPLVSWVDSHTGGSLSVLHIAFERFNRVRGPEAAASIGYYALFSLFPLLLVLVSVLGYLLVNQNPVDVIESVLRMVPVSRSFIIESLTGIVQQRSTIGLIGLAGLGWAASGVFLTLLRNLNRAWPAATNRSFLEGRLAALAMVALMVAGLLLIFVLVTLSNVLPRLNVPIQGSVAVYRSSVWQVLASLVPWFLAFLVFLGLYRWGPNTHVPWRQALWGAVLATIAWEIATLVFTWYLRNYGLESYQLIYGPLGASIALLTWIYLTAYITLFGAHISAAVGAIDRRKED